MNIEVLKSKIHRIRVTEANLEYIGSVTIDEDIMKLANIRENEKVQILNINNGERLETYTIKGESGSGVVRMNGPAARKVSVGDMIIIISYCSLSMDELEEYNPTLVFPYESNKVKKTIRTN